jgi:threonine/homoserine/homoserine lactone efflux protein
MFLLYLMEGITIGFLMAVPIGSVGILCIQRTISAGRREAYIVGLAGASADLVFSLVSAFGIRLVSDFITEHQYEIRIAGGALLLLMGIILVRLRRSWGVEHAGALKATGIYFSTLVLALTNPLVMFGYAAVISAAGVARILDGYFLLSMLVVGIFLGSLLWFVVISNLVLRFRMKVTEEKLAWVNRVAGSLLIILGIGTIWAGALDML